MAAQPHRHAPRPAACAVDVIVLSRDASELPAAVRQGLAAQRGVTVRLHRVIGTPRPDDPHAWATIARARNEGKHRGSAPWVMYLDDDVILGPDCIARLVEALAHRPNFAALAADYLGEMAARPGAWDHPPHVAMGATLFRRDRLMLVTFRWETSKCECRCACEDLRRARLGIGYWPGATARHEPALSAGQRESAAAAALAPARCHASDGPATSAPATGRILAAFNRSHLRRFRRQFLGSLRAAGNSEPVTAVAYGLLPSERRALAAEPGVSLVARPANRQGPAISRLRDFAEVIEAWPRDTPVAYWDAGDVFFQGRLEPLWNEVRRQPGKLLLVREPTQYPENRAIVEWLRTLVNAQVHQQAFHLFTTRPFLNAGFAAGPAHALLGYFRQGHELFRSGALEGVGPWGDQVALNLYCHTRPQVWAEVPAAWNYCLFGRTIREDYVLAASGQVLARDGEGPVHVVHGNARRLRYTELSHLV